MAKISRRHLAHEIVRILNEQPDRQAELLPQVAAYLIDTKRANQADLLMKDIADEMFLQQGHITAEIQHVASDVITADIRTALTQLLTAATGARTVELHSSVQPDLLGGIIVRTPRQELDASVRHQLKQIAGGAK